MQKYYQVFIGRNVTGGEPLSDRQWKKFQTAVLAVAEHRATFKGVQIVTQGAERAVQVESLRFSKLRVGSLVLGVVRQLKIDEAIISLPNNLTGVVHCRCAYVPSGLAELHFVRDS